TRPGIESGNVSQRAFQAVVERRRRLCGEVWRGRQQFVARAGADAVDAFESAVGVVGPLAGRLPGSLSQRLERAELPCQQQRIGLSDMADAQRIDEAVERLRTRLVDRIEKLSGGCLAITFPFFQRRLSGGLDLLRQC